MQAPSHPLRSTLTYVMVTFAAVTYSSCAAQESPEQAKTEHPKISIKKWSGTINVPDPVAVSVDNQGRVFATQTRRRKLQDLDIRSHREWIPDDVGLQSIEEKQKLYKQKLAIGGDQDVQKQWVEDVNEDGQHDWRDLTVISEVIYRLVDTDADGVADEMTTFSEDFKTEVTGIAAGVLAHEGKVYATVAPDLWKLEDTDDDGIADSKQSIATGFGLHVAYGGHDMHGPTVGHDGRIYWSIGDKGISAAGPDGRKWHFPNQGGVMRCNPDGSDFEVFAHGLRNVQEVAFDSHGNMFGVDNDADQTDERERFVHISEGMDAGWRCNYQYRGNDYNPWTDEKLWQLPGENHPAYIVPPIAHYIDGPAGFKFNPGTALSESYAGYFFLTGAPNGYQYAFRIEPGGDSFKMVDDHLISSGNAVVGLDFGPDGALYGADWDGGYPLDQKGAVVRFDVPADQAHPLRTEVSDLLRAGFADRDDSDLVDMLGHTDRRIRLGAQFELVKREKTYPLCTTARDEALSTVKRLHGIWGAAQLARRGDRFARDTLGLLLKDDDAIVRGQSAKAYAEIDTADGAAVIQLLDDKSLHVRVLAGLALARKPNKTALPKLIQQAKELTAEQHYLRHSIVSALAGCATADQLAGHATDESEMLRMCSVLALRRTAAEQVAKFLGDQSQWVATAAARAIHDDFSIPAALPKLAEALTNLKDPSQALLVRTINANYRIGDAASADRLTRYAASTSTEQSLLALDALAQWTSPPILDRVDGRRRDLSGKREIDDKTLGPRLAKLLADAKPKVQARVIAAAQHLGITVPATRLTDLVSNNNAAPELRSAALNMLVSSLSESISTALDSRQPDLQLAAIEHLHVVPVDHAINEVESLLKIGSSLSVRQASVRFLARIANPRSNELLVAEADRALSSGADQSLALDIHTALTGSPAAKSLLSKLAALGVDNGAPGEIATYGLALHGGSAASGKDIFRTHVQAQCARCHRIGKSGSEIGPELTHIATKRDAKYLLRALLQPSADIDAKYRNLQVLLESGDVVKGIEVRRDEDTLVLADEKGELIEIPTEDILESSEAKTSLMPKITDILSPAEVRDIVAYLKSLK